MSMKSDEQATERLVLVTLQTVRMVNEIVRDETSVNWLKVPREVRGEIREELRKARDFIQDVIDDGRF